eukprot:scaffold238596_cov25-Prasinocladus_malaysianus.AAC.2
MNWLPCWEGSQLFGINTRFFQALPVVSVPETEAMHVLLIWLHQQVQALAKGQKQNQPKPQVTQVRVSFDTFEASADHMLMSTINRMWQRLWPQYSRYARPSSSGTFWVAKTTPTCHRQAIYQSAVRLNLSFAIVLLVGLPSTLHS